ncbi:hypothetical protein DFA_01871 [Cavenderia fasciculata]|uniref:Wntless-like transmembrane domain-containing protein n=1 Tax=Cavenderia fasciculata TaxID=261658 RepID=F4PV77_CACFS|nr:uncharacterized protein DFA_01871 [Cavenderia fasciculata]EGG21985.1 hypothetical protein DFA_01871 [Cavenderia fasciculata]|eukprot:XP_004359836.1 hypothetical protein DFA_01871 [Cavenderia fasciculata]
MMMIKQQLQQQQHFILIHNNSLNNNNFLNNNNRGIKILGSKGLDLIITVKHRSEADIRRHNNQNKITTTTIVCLLFVARTKMIHIEPMDIEERSSKMMLHYMQRKHFIILLIGFFVVYGAFLIGGGAGPSAYVKSPSFVDLCLNNGTNSTNNSNNNINSSLSTSDDEKCSDIYTNGSIRIYKTLDNMDKTNRYFTASITLIPSQQAIDKLNQTSGGASSVTIEFPAFVTISASNFSDPFIQQQYNKTFKMDCKVSSGSCTSILMVNHIGIFNPNYYIDITIFNNTYTGTYFDGQLEFTFAYMNSTYSLMEIMIRLAFICITVLTLAGMVFSLRKYNWRSWTIEQQCVVILLVALFFYDNPFYLMTLLFSGIGAETIDGLFGYIFVSILFYFWFVLFDSIRKNGQEFTFKSFYLPKIIMVCVFFLINLVHISIYESTIKNNPLDSPYSKPSWAIFTLMASIMILIFLCYMVYLIAKGWMTTKTLPIVNIKLKLHLVFSMMILVAFSLGVLFSWFDPKNVSSIIFFSYFTMLNLYTYVLAIIYLPHPNSELLYQSTRLRDGADFNTGPSGHMKLSQKEEEEFNEVYL